MFLSLAVRAISDEVIHKPPLVCLIGNDFHLSFRIALHIDTDTNCFMSNVTLLVPARQCFEVADDLLLLC